MSQFRRGDIVTTWGCGIGIITKEDKEAPYLNWIITPDNTRRWHFAHKGGDAFVSNNALTLLGHADGID